MEPSLALNYYVAKDDIILILPTLLPECCCYKLHSYLRTSRKDECFSAYIHARSHQKGRVREGPDSRKVHKPQGHRWTNFSSVPQIHIPPSSRP
ncbi:hypothetical protein ACRRTK_015875 [Alexandromys fortis]